MRKVVRENEKDTARGGDITTRRGRKGSRRDRAIERPFSLDCRENQGDFAHVHVRAKSNWGIRRRE